MGVATPLKVIFVLLQLCFLVIGLGVIAIGVWLQLQYSRPFLYLTSSSPQIIFGTYYIIGVGVLVILITLCGIIGACCNSKCNKYLLGLYNLIAFCILAIQLAAAMAAFVFYEQAGYIIRIAMNHSINLYQYGSNESTVTQVWDELQIDYQCCGMDGVSDWSGKLSNDPTVNFPESCCNTTSGTTCSPAIIAHSYTKGCLNEVVEILSRNLLIVSSIGIGIVVLQAGFVICAVILLCITDYDD